MQVGTVVKWNEFPDGRKGGEPKTRWFICLGNSGHFSSPLNIYLCTTTTQEDDFKEGGKRYTHSKIKFLSTNTPFDQDCILDFDEQPFTYPKEDLDKNQDIEIKDVLKENDLRAIYNGIRQSNVYSFKIVSDIHTSLNMIGIEGLKKPKN